MTLFLLDMVPVCVALCAMGEGEGCDDEADRKTVEVWVGVPPSKSRRESVAVTDSRSITVTDCVRVVRIGHGERFREVRISHSDGFCSDLSR